MPTRFIAHFKKIQICSVIVQGLREQASRLVDGRADLSCYLEHLNENVKTGIMKGLHKFEKGLIPQVSAENQANLSPGFLWMIYSSWMKNLHAEKFT